MMKEEDLRRSVGGVLSYSTAGRIETGGQAIGANGSGRFCLIFMGSRDVAAEMAAQHIRQLERDGHREITSIFTPNDDLAGYYGNPMSVVTPNARIERLVSNDAAGGKP